ncbi:hypothetical protein GGS23DRAFT_611957 [Durotheca rogersii]|uniref:uncharacterized protein n=1 Tax=Durotheca rogersii TaxID=419775 RepID=UPI00221F7B66|nr:uncharacterized protein GGS23DRAFT_611957 [Durotheca rogersii]KAI5861413.1 hypothetical protein GGS23DRAFT_611957 [Durotheca rogersii]
MTDQHQLEKLAQVQQQAAVQAWHAFSQSEHEKHRPQEELIRRSIEEESAQLRKEVAMRRKTKTRTPADIAFDPKPYNFYGPGEGATKPRTLAEKRLIGQRHHAVFNRFGVRDCPKLKDEDSYSDEELPEDEVGGVQRPSYKHGETETARHIDWRIWVPMRMTEANMLGAFPGTGDFDPNETRFYLLNQSDFNVVDPENAKKQEAPWLKDPVSIPFEQLYPRGYRLLKKFAEMDGGRGWYDGEPLGPDPNSETALYEHLGWIMPRPRERNRGVGADPTDSVIKAWKHGDIDVPVPADFPQPPPSWSRAPSRVVTMVGSKGGQLKVQSFLSLKKRLIKEKTARDRRAAHNDVRVHETQMEEIKEEEEDGKPGLGYEGDLVDTITKGMEDVSIGTGQKNSSSQSLANRKPMGEKPINLNPRNAGYGSWWQKLGYKEPLKQGSAEHPRSAAAKVVRHPI